MGTQGIISLMRNGQVVRKIVTGCNGMQVPRLAAAIRTDPTDDPQKLLELAVAAKLTCGCLVIQVSPTEFVVPEGQDEFETDTPDGRRWRDTFHNSIFNPRWENGTAAYCEIVHLPAA